MGLDLDFLSKEMSEFEIFLKDYLSKRGRSLSKKGQRELKKSMEYTLFAECKRFRPALSFGACQVVGLDYQKAFPLAAALEFIHTASLIHDDLPSMDNDSIRRGKDSNHVVFKENIALLAGDTLLIEAFYLLSFFKQSQELIQCVSQFSSISGMMGGQALDLIPDEKIDLDSIKELYRLKTGALIQASVEGVFYLKPDIDSQTKKALKDFSFYLGLAFQLADDLQDKDISENSFLHIISKTQALKQLGEWTQQSFEALQDRAAPILRKLTQLNQVRGQE